jgi:PIN domain nuclease of toxin-antitoxin system
LGGGHQTALGKLEPPEAIGPTLVEAGAQPLPVTIEHAAALEQLPWVHRDPFDRVLVAQTLTEDAAVVSRDEPLSQYGVTIVW